MSSLRASISLALAASLTSVAAPRICPAQTTPSLATDAMADPSAAGARTAAVGPWEFTLDGRVGVPTGRLKVGEFPPGGGGGVPGTLLRLHTLGIDVSGALEGSAAFRLTPRDALRASYLTSCAAARP